MRNRLPLALLLLPLLACSEEPALTCDALCLGEGSADTTASDTSGSADTSTEDTTTDTAGSGDTGTEPGDTGTEDTSDDTEADSGSGDVEIDTIEGSGQTVEEFVAVAAATICGKLATCCDEASINTFFAPFVATAGDPADLYAAYTASIPPNAPFDAVTCPALLRDLYLAGPFGSWAAKVAAGQVTFASYAAEGCVQNIENAACGAELQAAIGYGSCVDIAAPEPGTQRPMFVRTGSAGDSCSSIRDGFGGLYYGSCDPTASFCCQGDAGRCGLPTLAGEGVCVAAAQEGESCSYFGDITLCATGLDCDLDLGRCVSTVLPEIARGDTCYDTVTGDFLGECVDSWCDFFGTGRCETLGLIGATCLSGEECESGYCAAGSCAEQNFCKGP